MGKSEKRCAEYWDKIRALGEAAKQASKELDEFYGEEAAAYALEMVYEICGRILTREYETAAEFWEFIEPDIFMG